MNHQERLSQLKKYEQEMRGRGFKVIAGLDEAGRGPLAGPVVSAACILPEECELLGADDSKKLTPKRRESLFAEIESNSSIRFGVGVADSELIDSINIYQATIHSMNKAVEALSEKPDLLLVDGMHLKTSPILNEKIIKGDSKVLAIAVASIIAKVIRDRMMNEYHRQWPQYGFDRHKGYGTKAHINAIKEHGPTPIHRKTFEPIKTLVMNQSH